MEFVLPFVIVAVVTVFVVAIIAFFHLREKKRTEEMQSVAESLGFQFQPGVDKNVTGRLQQFNLFTRGHYRRAWNVMQGETQTENLVLFDYSYTVGTGKSKHTYRQTIVAFETERLELPKFELRPERWWDKVTALIGMDDIDFEEFPDFSRMYHLSGDKSVREIFTEPVVNHFVSLRNAYATGRGQQLVFCFANRRVPPHEIKDFLEKAYGVYALLKEQPQKRSSS